MLDEDEVVIAAAFKQNGPCPFCHTLTKLEIRSQQQCGWLFSGQQIGLECQECGHISIFTRKLLKKHITEPI